MVLHQLLGAQRQDGYRLIRDLERFALVGRSWRDAVFSTPLHLNLDYLPDPKREAVRWLLKATFAELQMHPSECADGGWQRQPGVKRRGCRLMQRQRVAGCCLVEPGCCVAAAAMV